MANQIKLKNGSGSDPSASDLVVGEVALRTDNASLFTKKDDGTIAEIGASAGVSDGDKGDITVSNSGATFTIDNGVVSTAKIANSAITNDKLNNLSITTAKINDSQITTAKIAADAVTQAKIAANAVTDTQIASNAVTAAKISNGVIGNDKIATNAAIDVSKLSGVMPSGGGTFSGNISFSDNRQIKLGSSDDLKLFHNGTDSVITNTTGELILKGLATNGNTITLQPKNNESSAKFIPDGAVELYHNGTKKLQTDSAGTVFLDDTFLGDNLKANFGASADLSIYHDGSHARLNNATGNFNIQTNDFQITDSSNTTLRFRVDADGATYLRHNGSDKLLTTSTGANVTSANDAVLKVTTTGTASTDDARLELITQESTFTIQNDRSLGTDGALTISAGSEAGINVFKDGVVQLYNDGSKKFETSSSGVSVTGNITVSGTVDGRDLATDGSKLDGIESGATADQSASEILTLIKTVDGSGSGLDADLLDGANASVSAGNNTIVKRHSSGYIFANFFNTTPNDVTSGVTKVCVETGNDGYIRHGSASAIRTFINVANGATNVTNNNQLTNGAGYITSADGGNAATLDGIDSSQFLRSDANDTASGIITLSSSSRDCLNFSANSTDDNRGIAFNGRIALSADYNDGYLRLNNASEFSNGVFTPLVMRADGGFQVDGTTVIDGSGNIAYARLTGTPTIPTNNNQLTNGAGYITSATNNFVSSASFNTGNGVLTLNRSGLGAVTVDLDGRFATGTIPTNNNQLTNGRGFITGSGNTTGQARFLENSRTGSAPNYALRAWVNFKGTGSVSVRASGNVSSITDFGQGNYRVNFSTSMSDSNYATTTIGAYDKTNSLAPFIIFSQGGFGSNPIQYNTSGVRCGSTYGDFHIATLMFAR